MARSKFLRISASLLAGMSLMALTSVAAAGPAAAAPEQHFTFCVTGDIAGKVWFPQTNQTVALPRRSGCRYIPMPSWVSVAHVYSLPLASRERYLATTRFTADRGFAAVLSWNWVSLSPTGPQ